MNFELSRATNVALILSLALFGAGCKTGKMEVQLPNIRPEDPRITIELRTGPFPNEYLIPDGFFPAELLGYSQLERFSSMIRAGMEASGAFEVLEPPPGRSKSDAMYRLEYEITKMSVSRSLVKKAVEFFELPSDEFATVLLGAVLYENHTDKLVYSEFQPEENYELPDKPRLEYSRLNLATYFEKADRKNYDLINATINVVVRMLAETQQAIRSHEASSDSNRVGP